MKQKTYLDKLMENAEFKEKFRKEYQVLKLKDLIKELEKEMANSLKEDQFGYAKQDAWDVY